MSGASVLFYILGGAALIGGLGVVLSRNVVYAALALLLTLLAVAGLFLLLFAEFLALVQLLIYGGAVIILIFFALMLTRLREQPLALDNPQKPWAALAALGVFALFAWAALATPWPPSAEKAVPFLALGQSLFRDWAFPFELASLVLLVALIGAVVIALPEERK